MNTGELHFIEPVQVAKEFINYQRAAILRKQAILDAAKTSPHYDTTSAFFNDVTHRKVNNRI